MSYNIVSQSGVEVFVLSYGARLAGLYVPDNFGISKNIVLGFDTKAAYLNADEQYYGAIVGRFANRMNLGKFSLEIKNHQLTTNHGLHHLHGGNMGFHDKEWELLDKSKDSIRLKYFSEDGEEGYPGNLNVIVTYAMTPENGLRISYEARTDLPTPINLTHHSYFNLTGNPAMGIDNHILKINANEYTVTDADQIPTGKFKTVENTPLDFRTQRFIGQQINAEHPDMKIGNGYDHNYVLKKENSRDVILAAEVFEPISGRLMQVWTNQPGMQFYSGNGLSGKDKKNDGTVFGPRSAFCLETQHFPDSPNHKHFPSCILQPGELYQYECEYRFIHLPVSSA